MHVIYYDMHMAYMEFYSIYVIYLIYIIHMCYLLLGICSGKFDETRL